MRCDEFEGRLQEVLDRRGSPEADSELCAHLAGCTECRSLASAMGVALVNVAAMPVPPCSDDLAQRVLEELHPPVVRVRSWRWALMPLATAAGILIALPIASWLAGSRTSQPTAQQTLSQQTVIPAKAIPRVSMTELAAAWLPLSVGESEPQRGTTNPAGERWGHEVTEGFEPVTRSTTGALESLWKAIPTSEDTRS